MTIPHTPPLNVTILHNTTLNMTINFTSSTPPMATLEEEHVITVISEDMSPSHSWLNKIPDLAWPFIIIALGNIITATAFLVLALLGLPMPQFYDMVSTAEVPPHSQQKISAVRHPKLIP